MNSFKPEVLSIRLIDNHRIEIYWNQEMLNTEKIENYVVLLNDQPLDLHTNVDVEEWNKNAVFEAEKLRTTIYINNSIKPEEVSWLKVRINSEIISKSNHLSVTDEFRKVRYDEYYKKKLISRIGIEIKGSYLVSDEALKKVDNQISIMLEKNSEVVDALLKNGANIAVYAKKEDAYDIPEHRGGYNVAIKPVEGYGGYPLIPTTSISEVNVLRCIDGQYQTRYKNECILAHEFGHAIHLLGINSLKDQTLRNKIIAAYKNALNKDLFPKTYLMTNYEEYFATLTTMWFNVMEKGKNNTWDGIRGPINTRNKLKEYDFNGFSLMDDVYSNNTLDIPWK